jgi:FHA domain
VEPDFDDTVIAPVRPVPVGPGPDDSDTVVRDRLRRTAPSRGGSSAQGRRNAAEHQARHLAGEDQRSAHGFAVNSYAPIGLDRPAYVGRNPNPPRIPDGARPRLVKVPSPLGEVSSTHLELRTQGAMVIATDLRSTNGTRVRIPGTVPVRLRQNESIVVTDGTLIEIGDGNVIQIVSMRRAHPSGEIPGAAHT